MIKYTIFLGTDFSNNGKIEPFDNFVYYDNDKGKTVQDIKDFISCFKDNICSCMLNLYKKEKSWGMTYYTELKIENEEEKKLKDISQNSEIYIAQTKKKCSCNFLSENQNLFCLNKQSLIKKINELEKKNELEESKQEDFYDIIIDINSIININKGWNVLMTREGEHKYLKYKDQGLIKIGIVGNVNRGKTFILSKLSKMRFPSGVSINTKGLSIKYPELSEGHEKRKYILLDSAGLETPVLNDESEAEQEEKK